MYNTSSVAANHTAPIGWQDGPDGRGTYDILKSCLGTVALLCWSSVCPNVPGLESGRFARVKDKLGLFLLALLLPEAVLWVAVGQLNNAWNDKKAFKVHGYSGWGLRECFFVNMGGLFIQFACSEPPGGEMPPPHPFPVNCKQLLYLADMGHVHLPTIKPEHIEMRNKSDGLARTIAIAQVLWFTVSTLARVILRLHITSLELTTLSLVLIMIFTAAIWWRKPMDISHPIILECDIPLSAILAAIEDPPNLISRNNGSTPLSFFDRREWFLNRVWVSYLNILRSLCRRRLLSTPKPESASLGTFRNSFPSIELPEVTLGAEVFLCVLTLAYSSVFSLAWGSYFPTETERIMWRVSSVICVVYGVLGVGIAISDRYGETVHDWFQKLWRRVRKKTRSNQSEPKAIISSANSVSKNGWWHVVSSAPNWLRRVSNMSQHKDPDLDMKLRVWIPATILCMTYCFARAFIIIEDFIGLRRQPPSTYETASWSSYSVLF